MIMTCTECTECLSPICKPGFYGSNCDLTCSSRCRDLVCPTCTCEVCNQTTGKCTNGCVTGWFGAKCNFTCSSTCNVTGDREISCDKVTGNCLEDCLAGYYGDTCNSTCNIGCLNLTCISPNGTCSYGCNHGYKGDACDVPPDSGLDTDEIAGAIGGAFVVILWAAIVVILIFVIWRRRLKDYSVFNINSSFGDEPNRGSTQHYLRRASDISSCETGNHSGEEFHTEEMGSLTLNDHIMLHEIDHVHDESTLPLHDISPRTESRGFTVLSGFVDDESTETIEIPTVHSAE